METYSNHPFITYDGPDDNGVRAEVQVTTGLGDIVEINPSGKGKSANVIFSAANNPQYKMNGWVPIASDVYAKVEQAQKNGEPIHFRIEKKRQDHVDRSLPMAQISPPKDMTAAKENTFKSLAAVKLVDDDAWTVGDQALTNMAEDPSGSAHSANNFSVEELRALKGSNAPANNAPVSYGEPGDENWREPAPYITWINRAEGQASPGSNAVSAPVNIYLFVAQYAKEHEIEVSDQEIQAMAQMMLAVCNKAQTMIYNNKLAAPDMSFGSHTRARGLVFEITKLYYPLTKETFTDNKVRNEWAKEVTKKALGIWKWSLNIVENTNS